MAAFVVEGSLRLPRGAESQFIHTGMEGSGLLLQEQVQCVVGELITQEVLHLSRLLHLALVIIEFSQRNVSSPFGCKKLALNLLKLDSDDINLLPPVYFTSIP